jgi:hypothetical protein
MAGDPVSENATGLLLRNSKWMIEVIGVDGFRLDAAKHVPAFYWRDFYDGALFRIGPGGRPPSTIFRVLLEGSDHIVGSVVAISNDLDFRPAGTVSALGGRPVNLLERILVEPNEDRLLALALGG